MSAKLPNQHLLSARKTNPLIWWLAGLTLALVASLTGNLFVLLGICLSTLLVIKLCRDDSPWAQSISFYVRLASIVITLRLMFRIIFNLGSSSKDAILNLPSLEFEIGFGNTFHLFGPLSSEALEAALADGLRLAAIILAVGMANSLANPRKLLKATPGALYEIATAISIAINLAPQLIVSLQRVRRARSLRGQSKGMKSLTGIVIPVLEDTIDQSMALAASMSARGFGRKGSRTSAQILLARFTAFAAICLSVTGVALLLFSPDEQLLDLSFVCVGLLMAALSIRLSSSRANITRFRKEPWRMGDAVILFICSLLLVAAFGGVFA